MEPSGASSSTSAVPECQNAQRVVEEKTGRSYPEFLPAPRSRPQQGNIQLQNDLKGQINYVIKPKDVNVDKGDQGGEDRAGDFGTWVANYPRPQGEASPIRSSSNSKIQDTNITRPDGGGTGACSFGWFLGRGHSHDGAGGESSGRLKTGAVLLAEQQLGEYQQQVRKILAKPRNGSQITDGPFDRWFASLFA